MRVYKDEINNLIKAINDLDSNKGYYYESVLLEFFKIKKLPLILYQQSAAHLLFRTRINKKNDPFLNISEISYPKETNVNSYGRVNKPSQSMFYCSENRPTSYLELIEYLTEKHAAGDEITLTIGAWNLVDSITVALIFNPLKPRDNPYNIEHGKAYDSLIEEIDEEFKDGYNLFFEYIGSKFDQPGKNDREAYLITAAYSNLIFAHNKMVKGLIYPSVPFCGEGFNIAFLPEVVDDNIIRLIDVQKNVMQVELDNGNFNLVEKSISGGSINYSTNSIKWE